MANFPTIPQPYLWHPNKSGTIVNEGYASSGSEYWPGIKKHMLQCNLKKMHYYIMQNTPHGYIIEHLALPNYPTKMP